ncbi:hypothetical protein N8T08_000305 [Aspergillus melleus]|uniref:Uncharacterized protein n=1 Tax=Aspergillus melleus TaxID=138277 RepID=A0ACC3BAY3_9EURO|nr:hypothetical protein N8T08_000305 [Aspergillus melleus]
MANPGILQGEDGVLGDTFNLPFDLLPALSTSHAPFDDIAFLEQYYLNVTEFGHFLEPNRPDAPHTLNAARVGSAPANHPSQGNTGAPNGINPEQNSRPGPEASGPNQHANNTAWRSCWKDCGYSGSFGRKAELMRHIETQHVNPRAHQCALCGKVYNRKDNLGEHFQRVHA